MGMRALIVRKTRYAEKDLIVQFLLETGAVVSGFAAGAQKSKKRFPHQFHPAALYELESSQPFEQQKLFPVQRCDILEFEHTLSTDVSALCRWAMVLEWISKNSDHYFDFDSVNALRSSLTLTDGARNYFVFLADQMRGHGINPMLDMCVVCAGSLQNKSLIFATHEGGVAHQTCGHGQALPLELFLSLQKLFASEAIDLSETLTHQLDEILLPYLEHQSGRTLKSKKVFDSLGR